MQRDIRASASRLLLETGQNEPSESRVRDTEEILENEDVADLGRHQ